MRRVYNCLPVPMRSLAATCYGFHLRRLRYRGDIEVLVAQSLERDSWTLEKWADWHRQRIGDLLKLSATRVPYYRKFWEGRPAEAWRDLAAWPILEKESLRADPQSFLNEDYRRRRLHLQHTSGSTGTPLQIWLDSDAIRQWYAVFEARSRRWYGVSQHDRWGIFGGQLIKPVHETRPPFWVLNRAMHQVYFSSYHLSAQTIAHYLDALQRYRVRYLYGYSSALHQLAAEVIRTNRVPVDLALVVTNAEPLFDYQRDAIARAFRCPVRETYGMSEQCGGAGECEAGFLHLWPDAGYVEVMDGDHPLPLGQTGDLVFTGLMNGAMPLIRYRVGDRGALLADQAPCPCGRQLPRLARVEGRCDDVLIATDGRHVGRLDPVFKHNLPLREAQIIQQTVSLLRIKYVPAEGFETRHLGQIEWELRERLGNVRIEFERVSEIPRDGNGKFRSVINRVPETDRAARHAQPYILSGSHSVHHES